MMLLPHRSSRGKEEIRQHPSEPSPAELSAWMKRVSAGDTRALELLFQALYVPLCAFAETIVRSASAAEDVVGETFLKLWMHRETIHVRGAVRNYLYMAVRNTAISQLKRTGRETRYIESYPAVAGALHGSVANDAEERLHMEELSTRVKDAIERLPRRAQQTYVLYYQHHMSYAEIARVMGVSVKTVENQLARALRILWSRLEDLFQ
jgi:RNA polymerase sigma-70 factor (ECF subfamily)